MNMFIIRPHRSTTYVDATYCYIPSSVVCRSVTVLSPAKTAEPIEVPFGLWTPEIWTRVGPKKHVLGGGAHRRYLPNTVEPSMCAAMRPVVQLLCPVVILLLCWDQWDDCSHQWYWSIYSHFSLVSMQYIFVIQTFTFESVTMHFAFSYVGFFFKKLPHWIFSISTWKLLY